MSKKNLLISLVAAVVLIAVLIAVMVLYKPVNPLVAELNIRPGAATATTTAGADLSKLLELGALAIDGSKTEKATSPEATKLLDGMAKAWQSSSSVVLNGIDLVGGDLKALKFDTVAECQQVCVSDSSCSAFTYALPSHSNPAKVGGCWLKNGDVKYRSNADYVSVLIKR